MNIKKTRQYLISVIALLCLLGMVCSSPLVHANTETKVDVVFTHDLHSYLDGYQAEEDGVQSEVGGMGRLATYLKQKRSQNPDTLVVDGGDFTMGTLYHTVFDKEAIEYRMLGMLGYDATTLGNHEFDFGSEALQNMILAGEGKEPSVPPIVDCNIEWKLPEYVMVDKGGVSIAIIGVFGEDAYDCSPTCELTVQNPIESVKKTVQKIGKNEDADMIVCLSHSGTRADGKKSEDEELAKAVPELDLIISGHTHTSLDQPIVCGDTTIASCGAYGLNTGELSLVKVSDGKWKCEDYRLVRMDDSWDKDSEVEKTLSEYREQVNSDYLSSFGYTAEQVLAHTDGSFEPVTNMEKNHTEQRLGDLMSDAYRYSVNQVLDGEEQVDVAVVPAGVIRGTYLEGDITVADVFNSFSLGNGPDGVAGYPLIKIYLTGSELRTLAEVDASVSDSMTTARLYLSGLAFSFNPHRLILDKLVKVSLQPQIMKDSTIPLKDDKLYCVVADLYSGRMLQAVSDKSMGILKLVPKKKDGTKVTDYEECIVRDARKEEVKAWIAIAHYLESFEKSGDVSQIPSYYQSYHHRKDVVDQTGLWARIKNPGKYAWMIYGVVAGVIVLIIVIVMLVRRRIRKKRRK